MAGAVALARQAPPARLAQSFTVIFSDGRRPLPVVMAGDDTMVALDDLAAMFHLSVREDTLAGGVTVTYKGKSVILTPGQPLASAAGRIVSLPCPPSRDGRRWLVPVEFISRALAVVYDARLDVRKSSRLVLVGSVRAPQEEGAQPTIDRQPAAPEPPPLPRGGAPLPVLPLPEARSASVPAAGGLRMVVIDPGHGGADAGVRGAAGALEKDVTLAVARRLRALLESRLGVRVLLTRDADQAVTADERAALANNNMADLFLSLHANASVRTEASGIQFYYLSGDLAGDELHRAEAGRQVLPTLGGGSRTIEMIPWELAQLRHVSESAVLAESLEERVRDRVRANARAIQQAPLRVLAGVNTPAVLIEVGFLTNRDEEQQLVSEIYQGTVAQALLDGIIRFSERAGEAKRQDNPTALPEPARRRP